MKKSLFLYLKQGIKGVMKFRIQFIVIVILSFLATFVLSVSFSTTKRISGDYNTAMSKMDPFSYINQKTVGISLSDEFGTNIIAPMDILNNQFLYVNDSDKFSEKKYNKVIDINYNLSSFKDDKGNFIQGYQETFLTKTFENEEIQRLFLEMLQDKHFWLSIFRYSYNSNDHSINWDPNFDINHYSDTTSYHYLRAENDNIIGYNRQRTNAWKIIEPFYLKIIEVLHREYINELFKSEEVPNHIKNTLFFNLKQKNIISEDNFTKELEDYNDEDIYNRYLYFALESFIRQLLKSVTEYPTYWIKKSILEARLKDRNSIIEDFNKNKDQIGFKFLEEQNPTPSETRNFALTIFKFIFGKKSILSDWNKDEETVGDNFLYTQDNSVWKNYIHLKSGKAEEEEGYLNSKNEIFIKGMKGSLTQIVVKKDENNNVQSLFQTFDTEYLRHTKSASIEEITGSSYSDGSYFISFDSYKSFKYNEIDNQKAYYMKNVILAEANNFDYEARAEIEFTDVITEISYRLVDIESYWKEKLTIYQGNVPRTKNEILINAQYAKANNYKIGQNIKLGSNNFVISGYATEPMSYYPMGNTQNPLPNSKKNGIVYTTNENLKRIITWDLEKTVTKSIYSMLTYKNKDDKKNMKRDLDNYQAYGFRNKTEIYNSYKFINGLEDFNRKNILESYVNFESSNLKLNWTIAPIIISTFKLFAFIFSGLILLITITATVIAVKKTVELNSGEIGILKSMGVKNWEISFSYLSYGIVVSIFVAPLAWIVGSFIQEFSSSIFLQFSSGEFNRIVFSPLVLIISVSVFGVILCIISFFTSYMLVRKPTLEIINKINKIKRIKWLDKVINKAFKNSKFPTRFSMELAISGFSKTIFSATTVFVAGFLVSFGFTIPGIVQNVVQSYYKNVNYLNSYNNRDLIGNAPLAKTELSFTKPVDEYENNLIKSNNIFKNGINTFSKNIIDFAPSTDSSAIPQILLLEKEDGKLDANWLYQVINNNSDDEFKLEGKNSLISSIGSIFGNNISQLIGKGFSISDIQKILEWVIHSNSKDYENINDRLEKINDLSSLLTDGLPHLIMKFIKGSFTGGAGDWKEQIVNIIISQAPSYIKQYIVNSENRLNNFMFGWQVNKYIPGVDNFYTNLNVNTKNNLTLNITGLQSTQNAFEISDYSRKNTFLSDYQAIILDKLLYNKTGLLNEEYKQIESLYNKTTGVITIPVVANSQADFVLKNDWSNLTNPGIQKSRLVLRKGNIDIPSEAWMYDDGDWINYKKISNNPNYLPLSELSSSKFTYAPIFEESDTYFNLKENLKTPKLLNNSYGFYNFNSNPNLDGEELSMEIRPYYSYDNVTLFVPESYLDGFQTTINNGNIIYQNKWLEKEAIFVPNETKKAWNKIDSNLANSKYFAIKPYSYHYDKNSNYEREATNLSGTPVSLITDSYKNFFARTMVDNDGPIIFGNKVFDWTRNSNQLVKKIEFKKIDSIGVYGKPIIIADQNIVNILSGYSIKKFTPFDMKYEDLSKPVKNYTINGVNVDTYNYIRPFEYENNSNLSSLVYGRNEFEKSIRPNKWFTGIYSNAEEPYFITTQASFSRNTKSGQETLNGLKYGKSTLELNSTHLLGQQKTLIYQLSVIILSVSIVAICLMILIVILTVTLINDLYVNQYKKFMIVMKSLGYSNWKIIKYTFGTVTILSAIFYILGAITNFAIIFILFNIISKQLGSIPFGLTWWSPFVSIVLVFGAFLISIIITTKKIRKQLPSTLIS